MTIKGFFSFFTKPEKPISVDDVLVKKTKFANEAQIEATNLHPRKTPYNLICPVSGTLFKTPVITPQGHVYEKDAILRVIRTDGKDPQTRKALKESDLIEFPELIPFVQLFQRRITEFNALYEKQITLARAYAHGKNFKKIPSIFLCSINNQLLTDPVIFADGRVVNKQDLKNHPNFSDYVPFPELSEQLKVFAYNKERNSVGKRFSEFFVEDFSSKQKIDPLGLVCKMM